MDEHLHRCAGEMIHPRMDPPVDLFVLLFVVSFVGCFSDSCAYLFVNKCTVSHIITFVRPRIDPFSTSPTEFHRVSPPTNFPRIHPCPPPSPRWIPWFLNSFYIGTTLFLLVAAFVYQEVEKIHREIPSWSITQSPQIPEIRRN